MCHSGNSSCYFYVCSRQLSHFLQALEGAKQKAREAEARSNKPLAERTKLRKNQRNGNAQGPKRKGSAGRLTRGKVQQKMKKKVKKTMAIAKTVMNEGGNAKVKMNELYLDKGV